jgi:hypothetical protein
MSADIAKPSQKLLIYINKLHFLDLAGLIIEQMIQTPEFTD